MAALTDESVGIANEPTPQTYAAPTRFYEWADGSSHEWNPNRVQGNGLRVGSRLPRSGRRVTPTAEGQVVLAVEAISKGMGLLLESALGVGTSTLVSGSTYQQVFTPSVGVTVPSRTIQVGAIRADGTVDAVSHVGCTVDEWEFEIADELAMFTATFDTSKIDVGQSYAAPSYPTTPNLFHQANATMILGGSVTVPTTTALATGGTTVTNVRSFKLSGKNNPADDRFNLIGTGTKSRQLVQKLELTGEMTIEYTDTVARAGFLADTEFPAVLTVTAGALSTGLETFQIVLPAIKLDGGLPDRAGGELNVVTVPFTVLDGLVAANPIYVAMRTADTAL